MATASVNMQSVFVGPSGGLSSRNIRHSNQLFSSRGILPLESDAWLRVIQSRKILLCLCPRPRPLNHRLLQLPPVSNPKVSTKFGYLLAFSGPAPERINGRLAMVGFVAVIAVELSKGENVLARILDGGVGWILGTTVLLTLASMVPLFKGIRAESKSKGFMTSDAELWNGRFAMLGLVSLAFTEYVTSGTLV